MRWKKLPSMFTIRCAFKNCDSLSGHLPWASCTLQTSYKEGIHSYKPGTDSLWPKVSAWTSLDVFLLVLSFFYKFLFFTFLARHRLNKSKFVLEHIFIGNLQLKIFIYCMSYNRILTSDVFWNWAHSLTASLVTRPHAAPVPTSSTSDSITLSSHALEELKKEILQEVRKEIRRSQGEIIDGEVLNRAALCVHPVLHKRIFR